MMRGMLEILLTAQRILSKGRQATINPDRGNGNGILVFFVVTVHVQHKLFRENASYEEEHSHIDKGQNTPPYSLFLHIDAENVR